MSSQRAGMEPRSDRLLRSVAIVVGAVAVLLAWTAADATAVGSPVKIVLKGTSSTRTIAPPPNTSVDPSFVQAPVAGAALIPITGTFALSGYGSRRGTFNAQPSRTPGRLTLSLKRVDGTLRIRVSLGKQPTWSTLSGTGIFKGFTATGKLSTRPRLTVLTGTMRAGD